MQSFLSLVTFQKVFGREAVTHLHTFHVRKITAVLLMGLLQPAFLGMHVAFQDHISLCPQEHQENVHFGFIMFV